MGRPPDAGSPTGPPRTRRLFGQARPMTQSRFLLELPSEDVRRVGEARSAAPSQPRGSWRATRPRHAPPSRPVAPGDSYVDRSEGSDFGGGLHVGMPVRHRKFGVGRIVQVKPTMPPRVDVEFEGRDVRTIQVSYLQPA